MNDFELIENEICKAFNRASEKMDVMNITITLKGVNRETYSNLTDTTDLDMTWLKFINGRSSQKPNFPDSVQVDKTPVADTNERGSITNKD